MIIFAVALFLATVSSQGSLSDCINCNTQQGQCLTKTGAERCSCIIAAVDCFQNNNCPGANDICSVYDLICPELNCAVSGCPGCLHNFLHCLMDDPSNQCVCANELQSCSDAQCTTSLAVPYFAISCPLFQISCPSLTCPNTNNSCLNCASAFVSCASQKAKTSSAAICECTSDLKTCLNGANCPTIATSSLCAFQSSCTALNCPSNYVIPEVKKISALLSQYKSSLTTFLNTAIPETSITIGIPQADGNNQKVTITVTLPSTTTVEQYIVSLKKKLAEYFNFSEGKITITLTPSSKKRTTSYSGTISFQDTTPNFGTTTSLSFLVLALVSSLFLFF